MNLRLESVSNCLRVRFSSQGKRYCVNFGVSDTPISRRAALGKIKLLEADLLFGKFDPSNLDAYKVIVTSRTRSDQVDSSQIVELSVLWNEYLAFREPFYKPKTFYYMSEILGKWVLSCPIQNIYNPSEIECWLLSKTTVGMVKRVLTHLSAASKWALKRGRITHNPFYGMSAEFPDSKKKTTANAFSETEYQSIIAGFKASKTYSHYTNFVKFLFLTGCRPSEAIGLTWQQVSSDFSVITFDRSIVTIGSKPVVSLNSKNNCARKFPCNDELRELLRGLSLSKRDSLVFTSPEGRIISYNNFTRRAWKGVVTPLVNRDTTPYCCRDTFITLQVAKGVPVTIVAKWVDNSVKMIEGEYFDVSVLKDFSPV